MEDLSAPPAAPVTPGFETQKMELTSVDGAAKPKKATPATRYKELLAKQKNEGLTDKEKKEFKKLKADEMCEMLGKGC